MLLERTIGALEEETFAYNVIIHLAWGCPLGMVVAAGLQFGLYYLYNHTLHPFKVLVEGHKSCPKTKNIEIELTQVNPKPSQSPETPKDLTESESRLQPEMELTPGDSELSQSPETQKDLLGPEGPQNQEKELEVELTESKGLPQPEKEVDLVDSESLPDHEKE